MGEFGVMVEGGCHFFFSDQGPLLKGGGDVGGEHPCVPRAKNLHNHLTELIEYRNI
jgi:hypothetical protein